MAIRRVELIDLVIGKKNADYDQEAEIHLLEGNPPSQFQTQKGWAFVSLPGEMTKQHTITGKTGERYLAVCFYPENMAM